MDFIFTNKSEKQFKNLPVYTQDYIRQKLVNFKNSWIWDIKSLVNMKPATHRIRTWDYRLILQKKDDNFIVLKVWHRKEIYQ